MANDSSTGGYLAGTDVLADAALDALLQQVVVGLTALPGEFVRPRWQPVVPKQPDPATDWCAIGVTKLSPMDYPTETHDGSGDGSDDFSHWEEFDVLASFYGPNGMANALRTRDGLYVTQNREAMMAAGIDFVDAGEITPAPDLVNQQWIRRYDIPLHMRRKVQRTYSILNLLSADDTIVTDSTP